MPTKPKQSKLADIANLPDTVKAFGKSYKIAKFNLRQLAQAMEYAGYVGVLIMQAAKLGKTPSVEDKVNFVAQGIGISSPAFIPIVSIATGEPIEWLEEQDDVIGALEVFAKVVEKNRSFFTQENIDKVQQIFSDLLRATEQAGTEVSMTS